MKAFFLALVVIGCGVGVWWFAQRGTFKLRPVTIEAVFPDGGRATASFEMRVSCLAWPTFRHKQPLPGPPHTLIARITVAVDQPGSTFNVYKLFQSPSGPFFRREIPEERPEDLEWLPVGGHGPSTERADIVSAAILLLASLTVQPVSEIVTVSAAGTIQSRRVPSLEFPESFDAIPPVVSGGK